MELKDFDNALFKTVKDVGYQSCCLRGFDDELIVTYNTPKQTIDKKIAEIKRRFTVLPPGIYKFMCMQKHGARGKADTFLIKHGNFNAENFVNTAPRKALEETPHVLSYEEALKRIEETAQIKAENAALKLQIESLKNEVAELTAELEEGESLGDDSENTLQKTLSDLAAAALPVFDRYFDTKNKALEIEQQKLQLRKPKIIPGRRRPQPQPQTDYPDINNETELTAFLDELDKLNDDQLQAALAIIQQENAPLFDICIDEFFNQEEEEEEEQEEEQQN